MATMPHDMSDLYLAPVVLAIDARIERLAALDLQQLTKEVALVSDTPDWTRNMRDAGLLETVRQFIDCHQWELSWDTRGLRLIHGEHQLVLGVPPVFTAFLSGVGAGTGQTANP